MAMAWTACLWAGVLSLESVSARFTTEDTEYTEMEGLSDGTVVGVGRSLHRSLDNLEERVYL
jgi:hypothetical protein